MPASPPIGFRLACRKLALALSATALLLSMAMPAAARGVYVPPPAARAATEMTDSGFKANWTSVAGTTHYYFDLAQNAAFTSLGQGGFLNADMGTVTSYTLSGLEPNATYYYRVRAGTNNGLSANSNVVEVRLGNAAPDAPNAKPATGVEPTGFTANWDPVGGADQYCFDVASDWGFTDYNWGGVQNRCVGSGSTSARIEGLRPDWTYLFRVNAHNGANKSRYSNTVSVRTGGEDGGQAEKPGEPAENPAGSARRVNRSTENVVLQSACQGAANALGAEFWYSDDPNGEKQLAGRTTQSAFTHTPPNPGQNYYYWQRCYNQSGVSGFGSYTTTGRQERNPGYPLPDEGGVRFSDLMWFDPDLKSLIIKYPDGSYTAVVMEVPDGTKFDFAGLYDVNIKNGHLVITREWNGAVITLLCAKIKEIKTQSLSASGPNGAKMVASFCELDASADPAQAARLVDFDGDGELELLWRNVQTGGLSLWTLDGRRVLAREDLVLPQGLGMRDLGGPDMGGYGVSAAPSEPPQPTGTTWWEIAAASDFDGDGKEDVLWRNPSTGQLVLWAMDGAVVADQSCLSPSGYADWALEAHGDYNGDGKADLIWRNRHDGALVMWLMDGLNPAAMTSMGAAVDHSWRIKASMDYNGDGRDDILWRREGDYEVIAWLLDGAKAAQGLSLGAESMYRPWGPGN